MPQCKVTLSIFSVKINDISVQMTYNPVNSWSLITMNGLMVFKAMYGAIDPGDSRRMSEALNGRDVFLLFVCA